MKWIPLTCLLCLFGFVKEMRPSEAFLTLYLTGPWKNLTIEQVSNEIYPWWTYWYLIWLVPVFLLTDFLRYKPILVLDGLAFIGTWALLLWAQGVTAMKLVEVLYGLVTAGEIAYFSYLYVEVPKQHYKKISSFTRAATLLGKFLSFLLGQLFFSFKVMDYFDLHVFAFVSVCIAFIISLTLPWPKFSEIFHRGGENSDNSKGDEDIEDSGTKANDHDNGEESDTHTSVTSIVTYNTNVETKSTNETSNVRETETNDVKTNDFETISIDNKRNVQETVTKEVHPNDVKIDVKNNHLNEVPDTITENGETKAKPNDVKGCRAGFSFIWSEVKTIYTSRVVVVWSVWWAIASCGNLQVLNYVQNLWAVISTSDSPGDDEDVYNGAVEAASTLLGTGTVLLVGFLPINWSNKAELFMAGVCVGNAAFLIIMAHTSSIWVAYTMYVLFRMSYVTVITIATAQIAQHLVKNRYGLVFGCNMFASLVLETILTVIVVDKAGLGLGVFDQFTVYGVYFGVIGVLFFSASVYRCARKPKSISYSLSEK
ncbi:hypothetical protein ACF0H5_005575 [Mactra antiquata]